MWKVVAAIASMSSDSDIVEVEPFAPASPEKRQYQAALAAACSPHNAAGLTSAQSERHVAEPRSQARAIRGRHLSE